MRCSKLKTTLNVRFGGKIRGDKGVFVSRMKDSLLSAVDTFGNCQRLAFTVGVSQHNMHKITNL